MIFRNILLAGLGGGVGSIARYLCQKYLVSGSLAPFPIGTFLVNISGCFLIGLFHGLAMKGNWMSPEWRFLLTTGLCGGFTTFSAFAYENFQLLKAGNIWVPVLYIGSSVLLGIAAVFGGIALAR
ncbi:MAG TPA: fluoride efflux transporter CrcB [Puia sp.]|nr:fluoride efflux transporter CrcB [Puia sp.]